MEFIVSAGGVVLYNKKILLLKKSNGKWVLPKGRIEQGEVVEDTAIREVKEETNVDAYIIDFIGTTTYTYSNKWTNHKLVRKSVKWYIMIPKTFDLKPLAKEGFIEAKFVPIDEALTLSNHKDERKVIRNSKKIIEEKDYYNYKG